MRLLLAIVFAFLATTAQAEDGILNSAEDGILNPDEGGITQLRDELAARPERAGFICWVVYETQKGGLHQEAVAALNDCAASGNAPSMILLSHAYENGLGVEKSPELATHWVKQAALQGYSLGQYHYGMALMQGHGTTQDLDQGRYWLEQAAAGGSESAAEYLSSLSM